MLKTELLHVLHGELGSQADVRRALHALSSASGRFTQDGRAFLLFCDLAPAQAEKLPRDEPILRAIQSGVMTLNSRMPGRFHLLVRRRLWNDAARAYLGAVQQGVRPLLRELLCTGTCGARFEIATVAPTSLLGCCRTVLFSPIGLSCTPDTPLRLHAALIQQHADCLCARVLHRHTYPESVLDRLVRSGFSLMPLADARSAFLAHRGLAGAQNPALFTLRGLRRAAEADRIPLDAACVFVTDAPASLHALFAAFRAACLHGRLLHALLPPAQLALLFAAALSGYLPLAGIVLLPELGALRFPRMLPAALTRLALLPISAFLALDALLARLQATAGPLYVRVPDSLLTAQAALLTGAALLTPAFVSGTALSFLLPVGLLWLSTPLLLPALESPTIERIPLDEAQRTQLERQAESAFFDCLTLTPHQSTPALSMLAACAGSMLGTLEVDEAARRVQTLLDEQPVFFSAADHAAVLVCAQYLREHMEACDAALRELPLQLEANVLAQPRAADPGMLCAFLDCAQRGDASPDALASLAHAQAGGTHDPLFLPLGPARRGVVPSPSLVLTHPHTYLQRQDAYADDSDVLTRFLFLSAAALGHPFYALLLRSPVLAPYASLLMHGSSPPIRMR